jgi:hypothetical protein
MKKIGLLGVFIFALSIQLFGQGPDNIMSKLSKSKDMEKISVGSFGMFFIKLVGGVNGVPELKGIQSFELLTLSDDCPVDRKKEIRKQLENLKDDDKYSTLLRVKDNEDNVRIMIRKEKDTIKEVFMIVLSKDMEDTVVMSLKGNIKENDLSDLVAKHDKGK